MELVIDGLIELHNIKLGQLSYIDGSICMKVEGNIYYALDSGKRVYPDLNSIVRKVISK